MDGDHPHAEDPQQAGAPAGPDAGDDHPPTKRPRASDQDDQEDWTPSKDDQDQDEEKVKRAKPDPVPSLVNFPFPNMPALPFDYATFAAGGIPPPLPPLGTPLGPNAQHMAQHMAHFAGLTPGFPNLTPGGTPGDPNAPPRKDRTLKGTSVGVCRNNSNKNNPWRVSRVIEDKERYPLGKSCFATMEEAAIAHDLFLLNGAGMNMSRQEAR